MQLEAGLEAAQPPPEGIEAITLGVLSADNPREVPVRRSSKKGPPVQHEPLMDRGGQAPAIPKADFAETESKGAACLAACVRRGRLIEATCVLFLQASVVWCREATAPGQAGNPVAARTCGSMLQC